MNKYEVIGFDSNTNTATRKFISNIYASPSYNLEDQFIKFLIELLNKENIDIYIPTYSKEIWLVSKYSDKIVKESKAKFLVSPFNTMTSLENKENAYKILSKYKIDTPKIFNNSNEITKFPIYAKPKVGSGSKQNYIVNHIKEWEYLYAKYSELFMIEYLDGIEFTVDLFFNKRGQIVDYNQRERIKTVAGAAVTTKNNYSILIEDYLSIIQDNFQIIGPANIQFIALSNGRRVLTDINLRMPSGGMPLSVESGLDIPQMIINECIGLPLEHFHTDRKPRVMYRYYEEYFVEL
jgi:carbamoyl-phosphate synthase large subunit